MLLLAAAVFVGNLPCRGCHVAIADAYARTPMARSSGRAESLPDAKFRAAGHAYTIRANRLSIDQGSVPIDFFIGSNRIGRSFLFQREGYLFEIPVTWYTRRSAWDASPGYEREIEPKFDRAVDATCLSCHASRVRPVLGTQNRYGDPPFLDEGVSCERCHGPGSEHIRNPSSARMVNPARLDPERRDSVCTQCHLTGLARVERPGRRFAEYRAGEKLSDLVTYFGWAETDLNVTSHVERLAQSACKRVVGDKLWCGTCHEPHANGDRTQAACLNCHAGAHHRDESCVTCHMPQSKTADAAHSVTTDHGIVRAVARQLSPSPRRDLVALVGTADTRSLALAYAEIGDARARNLLARAEPADADVLLRRAAIEPDPRRAAVLYETVLRVDPRRPAALVNLGAIYAKAGKYREAARLWETALEVNPAIEGAALNLAQIYPAGRALAVLNRYLEFNPGSTSVRKRVAELKSAGPQ
jgi:tetratricopeptide (TPR) repeat protein